MTKRVTLWIGIKTLHGVAVEQQIKDSQIVAPALIILGLGPAPDLKNIITSLSL